MNGEADIVLLLCEPFLVDCRNYFSIFDDACACIMSIMDAYNRYEKTSKEIT